MGLLIGYYCIKCVLFLRKGLCIFIIRDGQNIKFSGYISIQCSMLDIQVRVFMKVIGAKNRENNVEKQEGKR